MTGRAVGSQGIRPNSREHIGRIGRGKIPDPAEERRVPHLDGDENDLVEREEHRNLDHHRQAAGDWIDALALEQLHLLLLLLDAIVRVEFFQRGDLRLDLLHLRHRLVGAIGEREEGELDKDSNDENGDAEIADDFVDRVDQPEHRDRDHPEPTPVDHQRELLDAELGLVIVDRIDLFGAGEDSGRRLERGPGRDRLFRPEEIGLVVLRLHAAAGRKAGVDRGGLLGNDRGAPILVGEAEPAADALVGAHLARVLVDRRVGDFLNRQCEADLPPAVTDDDADKALMEHRISGDVRLAAAQDEPKRLHSRRRAARIGDRIGDREHIFVVDGDDALEDEAARHCPRSAPPGAQASAFWRRRSIRCRDWAFSTPPALTNPVSAQ